MPLREQLDHALSSTYIIERELGGGGMSRVFLARELALSRSVVIKVLPPELSAALNLERFKREIQLAAALQHPHIVPVFTAGDVDGIPYFTMPFVEGQSLGQLLQTGELPVADVISILRDVSKALSYAHAHGVVHRDIKPDNILLSAHAATVTDFGVAKALTQAASPGATLTEAGLALGTPAYMSPEQATADPHVDFCSDLYALGVVGYEMLTGATPFAGRSTQQILSAQVMEKPRHVTDLRPSVPVPLADLIARCLAKRPADRPRSADDVLNALDALATPTQGLTPARPQPARSTRTWLGWTALAAAVLIAGAVVVAKPWSRAAGTAATVAQAGTATPAAAPRFHPTTIVVAPFTNMTGDTSLNIYGAIAAQSLSDGLARLDSLVVMSPSAGLIDSTGALRRFAGADAVRALGRESKAASVAWGSFQRDGDSLRFEAQVIDTHDGRVQITLPFVVAPQKKASVAIDELRDRLVDAIDAGKLKDRLGSMGRPPNAAAYEEFLKGLSDKWDSPTGSNKSSLPHFEAASRLDTTFLMASYYVTLTHMNLATGSVPRLTTEREFAASESAYDALARRIVPQSAVERDLIEDARAMSHADYRGMMAVEQRMQRRDSSLRMAQNLAHAAMWAGDPQAALVAIHAWPADKVPVNWVGFMLYEGQADYALGDYKAVLESSDRWSKRAPTSPAFAYARMDANAALGRVGEVRRLIDSVNADFAWNTTRNRWAREAAILRAHGYTNEAMQLAQIGLDTLASHPPPAKNVASRQAAVATLLFMEGKLDSVVVLGEGLAKRDSTWSGARTGMALIAALRHDTAAVNRALAALDSLGRNRFDHGWAQYQAGEICAEFGDFPRAVAYFKAAKTAGYPFYYDWDTDQALWTIRDYPPFKALMKPGG